jgi:nicotinamide-nucleotide amidase
MDDDDPGERVQALLRRREETVALAESATGGLVGSLVTDVPGSSEYFDRSLVTYSNEAKMEHLGVSRETLDAEGAVSKPVAREMARGVCDRAGTTWGVSTTGVAGPSGGTPEKPVGTVCVAVAFAAPWGTENSDTTVNRYELDGDRRACKQQFAEQALADLCEAIEQRER